VSWQLLAILLLGGLSSGSDGAAVTLACFAVTALIALATAVPDHCTARTAKYSIFGQIAGVAAAFSYAFFIAPDSYAVLAPFIVTLWVGVPIIVALFATWRHREDALVDAARPPQGVCANCQYDLTGTIEAGRVECPECGHLYEPDHISSKTDWLLVVLIVMLVLNTIANGICGMSMFA